MTGLEVLRESTIIMRAAGVEVVGLTTLLKLIDEAEKQEQE